MRLKWCKKYDIREEDLLADNVQPIDTCTNGLILELYGFARQRHFSAVKFVSWVRSLLPTSIPAELSTEDIRLPIQTKLYDKKQRISSLRRDNELNKLENETFVFSGLLVNEPVISVQCHNEDQVVPNEEQEILSEVHYVMQEPEPEADVKLTAREVRFKRNELSHEIQKKKKHIGLLEKKISEARCRQQKLNERYGLYKPKNVKRREKRNRFNLKNATVGNNELEKKYQQLEKDYQLRNQQCRNMSDRIKNLEKKVIDEQRMKSYYKRKWQTNTNDKINKLKEDIKDLRSRLIYEECKEQDSSSAHVPLKSGLVFTTNIRMCCMLLVALEVAADKIPEVIRGVAHFLFMCELSLAQLPGRQVVQNMVDEGQFLVKKYYEERLQRCHHFGVKKDGTSRQNKKIVTSCLRLDTGEVLPGEFKQVANETAQVIAKNVQEELLELSECGQDDDQQHSGINDIATKLTYTMSDRAANEKASNTLIDQWRDEYVDGLEPLQHFHCMAHPLLGFYSYVVTDLKKMQAGFEVDGGFVFGRDVDMVYKIKFGKQCVATRVPLLTCDIVGPMGDFRSGVQQKWIEHCRDNTIKNIIPNYQDNRFNALFECAAAIVCLRADLLECLNNLREAGNKNLKVKSVILDLEDDKVMSVLCALALTYCHVTHPYWNLVTSDKVEYLQLYPHLQRLHSILLDFKDNPRALLERTTPIFDGFPVSDQRQLQACLVSKVDAEMLDQSIICVMSGLIRCCEKQLSDFLGDGKFASAPSSKNLQLTSASGATTLEVERQFGSLDASMSRRRHASLHYHSTLLMLKANRQTFFTWLESRDDEQLWERARKFGKKLRVRHREKELKEKKLIHDQTKQAVMKSRALLAKKANKVTSAAPKKRKAEGSHGKSKRQHTDPEPPTPQLCLEEGQWVAVAYESGWYPGRILEKTHDLVRVDFLHPGRGPNYKKPEKPDVTNVEAEFIFSNVEEPTVVSRGRRYRLKDHSHLIDLYERFHKKWMA